MYRANLSWIALRDALTKLEQHGLIKLADMAGGTFVSLTEKGFLTVEKFKDIDRIFEEVQNGPGRHPLPGGSPAALVALSRSK